MESYLQIARTAVLNSFADGQFVHVVLGNEACDLDSAVSALTYAFFLHKTRTAIPRPNTAVIPLLNIKRHELYLHTDVNHFLSETGVPLSLLSFRDDLDLKALHAAQKLTLTLVDHNTLSREDSFLAYSVTEIIDHHAKLPRTMTQRCYITLEMVGSCCTLVADRFLNTDHSNLLDRQIALLLYGTILLDTICLNDAAKRVTGKDKMVAEKLHEFLSDVDRDALFRSLHKAKCDVSGLSVEELLRRDLKSTSNDTMKIAVSTISSSLKEFLQRPNAEVDLERFAVANACQIVVLMGVQVNTDTLEVERQLAVYSAVQGYREQIVDLLEAVSTRGAKLCLQSWPSPYSTVVLYHQGNVAATRKVVLPLLHMFLHGDRSPSVSSDPSSTIKNGCRPLASSNGNNINNGKSNGEDDQNMADYDPLAAESEDIVPLNNPIGNPASSQLHMLGVGDPMSHAGSSQSSNQNSCPYTPQNSCTDGGFELDPYARQILPSFNSREMMEKIETKRGKLRGYDEGDGTDNPYPFTPKNSFVDGSFEAYVKQTVPSFDSGDFLLKVNEKVVAAAAAAAASSDAPVTVDADEEMSGSITVEVPQVAAAASARNGRTRDSTAERDDPTNSLDKPLPQKCPEASFSEQLDKSTEIMDTAETSASSDKTSPFPTDLETMNTTTSTSIATTTNSNDVRDNQPILKSEMTSQIATTTTTLDSNATLSTADLDLDLAANYQTETVDFPDSPRQLKFLTQSTQGLSLEETVPEEEEEETEQPEDEDFRAVLSPSSDGVVKLKKEVARANNDSFVHSGDDDDDDDRFLSSLESLEFECDPDDSVMLKSIAEDEDGPPSGSSIICSMNKFSTPYHSSTKSASAANFELKMSAIGHLSAIVDVQSVNDNQQQKCDDVKTVVVDAVSSCLARGVHNVDDFHRMLRSVLRPEVFEEILSNERSYRRHFDADVFEALELISLQERNSSSTGGDRESAGVKRSIITVDRSRLDQSIVDRFGMQPVLMDEKSTSSASADQKGMPASELRLVPRGERAFFVESFTNSTKKKLKFDAQLNLDDADDDDSTSISSSDARNAVPERPNTLTTTGMKKRKIKVNADILNASEDKEDDQRSWSSLSNRSDGDILTPGDDMATPDDIDTPDDLDDSVTEVTDPIPEVSAAEERNEERRWRTCVIGGVQRKIDLKVIEPYKKVLSHGGYYGPKRSAIIVFSACYLPDHGRKDYDYVMDNLFLYVLTTLDQLVAEDYVLVYLHGALDRSHMPTFGWLKRCYQMIDRRLRKNLKGLYLVHPTFWLKTIVLMTKPFISTKFSRKLQFVNTLQELADLIPVDQMSIPDKVKQLEFELMIKEKKRQQRKKDKETAAATTTTTEATTAEADSSSEDEINNSVEGACELNFRRIQAAHYAYGGGWF